MLNGGRDELIRAAVRAKEAAYVPYSGYRVGAALLTASGKIFTGCNVENSSFGGTICAERTAIVKAVSEGERDFIAMAVAGSSAGPASPCGICRQFISEFCLSLPIVMVGEDGTTVTRTVDELLPFAFGPGDVKDGRQD